MEKKFLKCGCAAAGSHRNEHDGLPKGHPSCMVHDCCEVVAAPNLIGRTARCAYFGKETRRSECSKCGLVCTCECASTIELAFFKHDPEKQFDEFYCGCHSWD